MLHSKYLSGDLRQRVVDLIQGGQSKVETARTHMLPFSTVSNIY